MIERLKMLCVFLFVLVLLATAVRAETGRIETPTERYQLDTGATVYVWLDEPRGLLCEAITNTGLTCVPLAETAYNWPAIE